MSAEDLTKLDKKPDQKRTVEAKRAFLHHWAQTTAMEGSARVAGVTRACVYEWLKSDPEFKEAYLSARRDLHEQVVLSPLMRESKNGNVQAAIYLANTKKFRHLGLEKDPERIDHTHKRVGLNDEELDAELRAHGIDPDSIK